MSNRLHIPKFEGTETKEWRAKVAGLTKAVPCELAICDLKSLLFVLANYLSSAPYEEDMALLHAYIKQLRYELESRTSGAVRLWTSSESLGMLKPVMDCQTSNENQNCNDTKSYLIDSNMIDIDP